ncbi:MAG: hypothetical protein ACREB9_08615 [Thermoplasmata archaeon]
MVDETSEMGKGLVEGLIEALSDKHSQVDVHLQGLTMSMGDSRIAMHLSGTVTMSVHMRELTTEEKSAHASANIAKIQSLRT